LLLTTVPSFVVGQSAIPDTPAGQVLKAWLEAFNSGEKGRMDAYNKKHDPSRSASSAMGFRNMTGGFDLVEVRKSAPLEIEYRVKERNPRGAMAVGKFIVESRDGDYRVVSTALRAIPPGGAEPDFGIDENVRSRVIEGVARGLNEKYVFPETAKKMGDELLERQRKGAYRAINDGEQFAALLTTHLRETGHDKHLGVSFSPFPQKQPPPGGDEARPALDPRFRQEMERQNCAFRKVEILGGNIGYVKLDAFIDPDICGPTVVSAMGFIAHSDVIVFDLRENGGGDPKMVAMISSYLFAKSTHLNSVWNRRNDKTEQFWTLPYIPGTRMDSVPVYVLTSTRTFSAAEEFSYNLKSLKRATIVGETTGGGAHPVIGQRLDDRFSIQIPFARSINPVTGSNWEGTGVEPDVKVPQGDALNAALKLAREKLAAVK